MDSADAKRSRCRRGSEAWKGSVQLLARATAGAVFHLIDPSYMFPTPIHSSSAHGDSWRSIERRRAANCATRCTVRDIRYPRRVRMAFCVVATAASLTFIACEEGSTSPGQSAPPTVRIAFVGSTTRRSDLPPSAQPCVDGVGATHIHPSWRNFASIALQPVPPDRYEITFTDVPVGTRVSFRINDQNSCDENPTGAVTRNVFANDVRLIQNTTTQGNGQEPGYALTIAANGTVSQ